jgi:hypothetical protein
MRDPAQWAARNANNVLVPNPAFRYTFLFVPGFRPYSDANPEQIASPPGRLPGMPGMRAAVLSPVPFPALIAASGEIRDGGMPALP